MASTSTPKKPSHKTTTPHPKTPDSSSPPSLPRQIRATHTLSTLTLYCAFPPSIALPALSTQKLTASPAFLLPRFTWFKPSYCWMLYRSGYSLKDPPSQAHILALQVRHEAFRELILGGKGTTVCEPGTGEGTGKLNDEEKGRDVRVQWDPERDWRLRVVDGGRVRSLQIGVRGERKRWFVEEGVVGIEDVTGKARELKGLLDERGGEEEGQGEEDGELRRLGLLPEERVLDVEEELARALGMDVPGR